MAPPTSNPLEPNVSVPPSKPWGVGSGTLRRGTECPVRTVGYHSPLPTLFEYHSPLPTLLGCLVGKTPIVLSPTSL